MAEKGKFQRVERRSPCVDSLANRVHIGQLGAIPCGRCNGVRARRRISIHKSKQRSRVWCESARWIGQIDVRLCQQPPTQLSDISNGDHVLPQFLLEIEIE